MSFSVSVLALPPVAHVVLRYGVHSCTPSGKYTCPCDAVIERVSGLDSPVSRATRTHIGQDKRAGLVTVFMGASWRDPKKRWE